MRNTKQIILVRTDLNMPVGKIAAQVSHASMAFLTRAGKLYNTDLLTFNGKRQKKFLKYFEGEFADEVDHWLTHSFTKICVGVKTLEDMYNFREQAVGLGLHSELIVDNGRTCFNNELTPTCLAIGPHYVDKFEFTKKLRLL